jgi:hypothetical protein
MRTGFAWAASLVLAVGFGYYLSRTVEPRSAAAPSQTAAQNGLEADSLVIARQENAPADKSAAHQRPSAPPSRAEEVARRIEPDSLARNSNVEGHVTQPPAAVTLRGDRPQPLDTAHRSRDSAAALDAIAIADAQSGVVAVTPRAGAAAAPSANRIDSRSVRNPVSTSWPVISRGKAASLLGDRPVGVPGLATRGIRSSPTGDTVVVEQTLDSRTVIQIFQHPANTETDALGARERADRVLARYVGRLRVEIVGPVSTDSLNKLLELVEPLP